MMLFAVQSLGRIFSISDFQRNKSVPSVPMCDILLVQEFKTLVQGLSGLIMPLIRETAAGLTSQICVKKATNSPYVRKWGSSNGRRYGITINFRSRASGSSKEPSNGTQWFRGSRLSSGDESCRTRASSCGPLLVRTFLSMTCFPSLLHVASIAVGS